ncbi:NB-ARC domain-containing protein [Candidatus Wolbachia massiliensis]|uniref:ATP-binding protein n=1 Tax=Candidatus Wolbachia massiliensis TaxID=1845000 RepID=A0A7L7YLR7_9RICK|nr:NB-ARC domain-containing protein [Candidatus Wolbachia massiliensis]QOD38164.1 ATP-binding protein [Candidatus Wolbachia massiliensis]
MRRLEDPTWGLKCNHHGIAYQELLLVFSFMNMMDKKCPFYLATELKSAKGFDDIVLQRKQNEAVVHKFVQAKHKQDGAEKISVGSLLTKSGEFNLSKYFIAYLKIKNSGEFESEIKDFIIATNIDFDFADLTQHEVRKLRMMLSGKNKGKEISVIRVDTQDEFLDIGDSARYGINDSDGSIAQYLKQNMDFIKRKVGREVSDKEIEGFLNELTFAVNLPNEDQLKELFKGKINNRLVKKFRYVGDTEIFCNDLLKKISDWVKDVKGSFFSHKEGEELFEKVEHWASTLGEIEQGVKEGNERASRIEEKVDEIVRREKTSTDNQRAQEPIWFNMMEPVASFTGRSSELKALHDALRKSTGRQAIISQAATISGLGGIGKSEVARKYAYSYEEYYDGNAIWINAESFEYMKNSFLRLAEDKRVGISHKDRHGNDKTIEAIVEEIYAFFARRRRKSLFIFDNAEEYKDIRRFLPSSLPLGCKKPYILITSRNKNWRIAESEGEIKTIQLGVFKETEAVKFIKRALNIRDNLQDEEIRKLTQELQYFPLALGQAVAYINEKNIVLSYRGKEKIGINDYLKKYRLAAK